MLKRTPAIVLVLISSSLAPGASGAAESGVQAVLELFTSQSCASCPPADELLEKFSGRKDVVALSFSVDLWDYQGWKDTLATHDFTKRQFAYASARGDRQVFTPEMVVNGRYPVVGSDEDAIEQAILRGPRPSVPIRIGMMGDAISVEVGAAPEGSAARKATLSLVLYDQHVAVPVARGENRDRTLDYYNVVRKISPIAVWRGDPMKVDVPMSDYHQNRADGCAVLLQQEDEDGSPGPILGAAMIEDPGHQW